MEKKNYNRFLETSNRNFKDKFVIFLLILQKNKNGRNTDLFGSWVVNGLRATFFWTAVGREFKIHLFILFNLFILFRNLHEHACIRNGIVASNKNQN